jgi:hypothetical protein
LDVGRQSRQSGRAMKKEEEKFVEKAFVIHSKIQERILLI